MLYIVHFVFNYFSTKYIFKITFASFRSGVGSMMAIQGSIYRLIHPDIYTSGIEIKFKTVGSQSACVPHWTTARRSSIMYLVAIKLIPA